MGFWAGFSNQMNINKEASARKEEATSAREFSAEQSEMDREQRRQEIAATLRQRRQEAVVAAAASRGLTVGGTAVGVSVGGVRPVGSGSAVAGSVTATPTTTAVEEGGLAVDTGPTVSTEAVSGHYADIILNDFGANSELLAPFAALGDSSMSEIFDAVDTARVAYVEAGRGTEFTPDVVNNILSGVRTTIKQGGTVQWEDLAAMAGLDEMSDEEKNWINLSLGGPQSTVKTTILNTPPKFPLPMEDIAKFKTAATGDLVTSLESLQITLDNKSRDDTITPEEATTASDVSRAIVAINENDGTVPNWVISQFGALTISPYIQNEPKLLYGNLGGAWDIARQRVFGTEEDVSNAIDAGTVKYGDTVVVAGRTFILNK